MIQMVAHQAANCVFAQRVKFQKLVRDLRYRSAFADLLSCPQELAGRRFAEPPETLAFEPQPVVKAGSRTGQTVEKVAGKKVERRTDCLSSARRAEGFEFRHVHFELGQVQR